ncbi:MAG: DUF2723 domain-containing protein [Bdellovibrionota bacterium]
MNSGYCKKKPPLLGLRFWQGTGLITILAIAALYLIFLPHTVQTGDTGELVANAYLLQVAHPPGYPLWLWIQHLATHLIPVGTVFWRASLLNAMFSVAVLSILFSLLRKRPFVAMTFTVTLGLSRTYWLYSELPDVFMLNNLLVTLLLFNYFKGGPNYRTPLILAIFALALTNHHTAIFLLPVVIETIISEKNLRKSIFSICLAFSLFCAAYLSIFLMDTEGLNSWGNINTPGKLLRHMLRMDYGTFKLTATPTAGSFALSLRFLGADLFKDGWPVLLLMLIGIFKRSYALVINRRQLALLSSLLLLILVFFWLANLQPEGFRGDVLERFFILPTVMLTFFLAINISKASIHFENKSFLVRLAIVLLIAGSFTQKLASYHKSHDFSKNTVIEDYAINQLRMIPKNKQAILFDGTDTGYYSMRYAQLILQGKNLTIVTTPGLIFGPWYLEKIKKFYPDFTEPNQELLKNRPPDISTDLIMPNLKNFSIHFTKGFNDSKNFHITYLALGRRITKGKGVSFEPDSFKLLSFRSQPSFSDYSLRYEAIKEVYSEYAYYHLAQGMDNYRNDRLVAAKLSFLDALKIVPYCTPAVENLCSFHSKFDRERKNCLDHLEQLMLWQYQYF